MRRDGEVEALKLLAKGKKKYFGMKSSRLSARRRLFALFASIFNPFRTRLFQNGAEVQTSADKI